MSKLPSLLLLSAIALGSPYTYAQSTPPSASDTVRMETVQFPNGVWKIAGNLYLPAGFDAGQTYAAIVVVHPGGGVKEQTAGLYAHRLAEAGFITLAFDATHQGASEGEPRHLDSPYNRVEDTKCAVDFLTTLPYVDRRRIGAMGVCAGGGYAINTALTEKRIRAVAAVSPVDAGLSTREGWAGGNPIENQLRLMEQIAEARTAEANGEAPVLTHHVPETVDSTTLPDFVEAHEYYRTPRGGHPNSDNLVLLRGFADRLAFNSFALIPDYLTQPLLVIVGSKAASRWMGEKAVELSTHEAELYVVEGATHVSLYDIPRDVDRAVTRLTAFFSRHLAVNTTN